MFQVPANQTFELNGRSFQIKKSWRGHSVYYVSFLNGTQAVGYIQPYSEYGPVVFEGLLPYLQVALGERYAETLKGFYTYNANTNFTQPLKKFEG